MSILIDLKDIVKLQHYYIERFYEEDDDYPDYRRIGQINRRESEILDKITNDREKRLQITDIIAKESWNFNDRTFKPICDSLRALGYKILSKESLLEGDN